MAGESVAGSNIKLGVDFLGIVTGLNEARKQFALFSREINTNVANAYKAADAQQKVFRSGLTRLSGELKTIGNQLSLFGTLPTLFAAGAAFKTFADLQKLEIGLAQYGESLKTVRQLAKLPNVSIEGAAQSLLQLRAVGVESQFAQRSITAFANALTAAGKSSVDLNPALTNIVQMLSTGVVSAADVKELANRIPQARKALIDAFGTASGEELTKKGVGVVVEGLIKELEKIPPVAGGAGMALEKLGDDAKFGLAKIGESIDKSFGITGTINSLADTIGVLTEKFISLDPKTQKAILGFVGMAAIIPTLITAVGGAIAITTMFATGLGVAAGSVFAISAAVAIAGTAIIANWDDIKGSVGDTGVWSTLANIGGSTLNALVELFKIAANLITGDWGNMQNALINMLKNIGNAGVQIVGGMLKILPSAFKLVTGINTSFLTSGVDKLVNALTISVPSSVGVTSAALDGLKKKFDDVLGGIGNIPKAAGTGKGLSDNLGAGRAYKDLLRKENEELQERVRLLEEIKKIGSGLKELTGVGVQPVYENDDKFNSALANKRADEKFKKIGDKSISKTAADAQKQGNKELKRSAEETQQILSQQKDRINGIINSAASDGVSGISELIGAFIAGEESFASFGKKLLGMVGSVLKELGKSLIGFGLAGEAIKNFKDKPGLALAAGAALTIIGSAVSASASKTVNQARFAKGGFAYGEMQAIVGDNPNARFDPEMIAPYSKVDQSIKRSVRDSGANRGFTIIPEVTLKGQDFVIAFRRAEKSLAGLKGF
ncbi:tape measure protein [Dyadobacter sp. CY323]|uniref:tape measure protein n=1 Tax=Dyadobacter sp. CY323 TaxID=2907302 RepID=UPI001F3DD519|nr:tape measure protein [Dyadobacter sp. CY323]MCE6992105.1 tape measure protein [Dyadobacter sp. CY323]